MKARRMSIFKENMASRLLLTVIFSIELITSHSFNMEEATISDIQSAFTKGSLTSRQLIISDHCRGRANSFVESRDLMEGGCGRSRVAQTDRVIHKSRRHSIKSTPYPTRDAISAHHVPETSVATPVHSREAQTNRVSHATIRSHCHGARATPNITSDALSTHGELEEAGIATSGPTAQTYNMDLFGTSTMSIYHGSKNFNIEEATINDIQSAFTKGSLTSHQLVNHYLNKIQSYNHVLHAVIEVNPDALKQAKRADWERKKTGHSLYKGLHGIPVLLKDNIATKDRLNTTAGSLALLGSVVPHDAGVVNKLRLAGAIILGKASMSEWSHFRSFNASNGWSARGGQGKNPYVLSADPCGSSSGSAIAVAANMATVALGTETAGSIICPASVNSVVGIKPTVGITSRSGVIPVSPRQDSVGPIARTVRDAVVVLEAMAGFDERDADATLAALKYIPKGGYLQFLNASGMKGKRIGILRKGFFEFAQGTVGNTTFEEHFKLMRKQGAVLIDNLEIPNISIINDFMQNGELAALPAEFKISLDMYLSELLYSPVKSLLDVISFNKKHAIEEKMSEIGQVIFLVSQNTSGIGPLEQSAIEKMKQLSMNGIEKVMHEYRLDAIVSPNADASEILAFGGYPGISIPAGYDELGVPFAITFGGLRGYEPKLIQIAFSFEQSSKIRKPPSFRK